MGLLGGLPKGCTVVAVVVESKDAPWELQVALMDEWSRRHDVCISSWIYRSSCNVEGLVEEIEGLDVNAVVIYYSLGGRRFCDRTRLLSRLKRRFRVYTVN